VPVIEQTNVLDAVGITANPVLDVVSFELVDGFIVIVFNTYEPELTFSAYEPELTFSAYQPELDFATVYTMED
jgi:hypothetical protein